MRISDWSSDVCSSDLAVLVLQQHQRLAHRLAREIARLQRIGLARAFVRRRLAVIEQAGAQLDAQDAADRVVDPRHRDLAGLDLRDRVRSEEHTSELQSLMRISYAVFCLKKKNTNNINTNFTTQHNNKE